MQQNILMMHTGLAHHPKSLNDQLHEFHILIPRGFLLHNERCLSIRDHFQELFLLKHALDRISEATVLASKVGTSVPDL